MATVDWIALAVVVALGVRRLAAGARRERSLARRARRRGLRRLAARAASAERRGELALDAVRRASSARSPARRSSSSLASLAGSFVRGGLKLTPLRLLDSAGGNLLRRGHRARARLGARRDGAARSRVRRRSAARRSARRSSSASNAHVPPAPAAALARAHRPDPGDHRAAAAARVAAEPAIVRDPDGAPRAGLGRPRARHRLRRSASKAAAGSSRRESSRLPRTSSPVSTTRTWRSRARAARPRRRRRVRREERPRDPPRPRRRRRRPRCVPRRSATGRAVAIVGYPGGGPLTATPGRIGETAAVLTRDAYGHGPVSRTITAVAGTYGTATRAARRSTPTATCRR